MPPLQLENQYSILLYRAALKPGRLLNLVPLIYHKELIQKFQVLFFKWSYIFTEHPVLHLTGALPAERHNRRGLIYHSKPCQFQA